MPAQMQWPAKKLIAATMTCGAFIAANLLLPRILFEDWRVSPFTTMRMFQNVAVLAGMGFAVAAAIRCVQRRYDATILVGLATVFGLLAGINAFLIRELSAVVCM